MSKEAAYSIRVVRRENGHTEIVEFKDYGVLAVLIDDITKAVEERGWLEDEHQEVEPE